MGYLLSVFSLLAAGALVAFPVAGRGRPVAYDPPILGLGEEGDTSGKEVLLSPGRDTIAAVPGDIQTFLCDPIRRSSDVDFVRGLVGRFGAKDAGKAWTIFLHNESWQECGAPALIAVGILGEVNELKLLLNFVKSFRDSKDVVRSNNRIAWAVTAIGILVGKFEGNGPFGEGLQFLLDCSHAEYWLGALGERIHPVLERQLPGLCMESLGLTRNEKALARIFADIVLSGYAEHTSSQVAFERVMLLAENAAEVERWISYMSR